MSEQRGLSEPTRCWTSTDPLYVAYHDEEWGRPVTDERGLLERLCLEGFQSGLSWLTILRKRENFRTAFAGFDPERVARFRARDVERLLKDPGIVRNRAKVEAAVANARAAVELRDDAGRLDAYLWRFVEGRPIRNRWKRLGELPAETPVSKAMSKDLKARGFRFVGPTICYAFMQAVGMVNDHVTTCFRYREVGRENI